MRTTAPEPLASSSSGGTRRRRGRSTIGVATVVAGATLLSGALVAGSGAAALADAGDGICTITVQLPATAESGQPFTMQVLEDSDCAGVSGLAPFTASNLVASPLKLGYAGVEFTHTPGTGNATYQGTAPNPGAWRPRISSGGTAFGYVSQVDLGYQLVITTMETTPQVTVAPTASPARAVWVNDMLRITYPRTVTFGEAGNEQSFSTFVDGKLVFSDQYEVPGRYGAVEVHREASAGPAKVEIVGTSSPDYSPVSGDTDTIIYSRTIAHQVVTARKGQVSADALLDDLRVRDEAHSGSYSRSKFTKWVDANHDGENTRAEVLKSESLKTPKVDRHGRVTGGRWTSPYDGKISTNPSRFAVDHLVPLTEAWTSGASSWSTKKRTAFANDTGYGPSLIAVSKTAIKAKGGDDVVGYLPPTTSYRCTYVRNWIAVKHRWGLSVDPTEKNMLNSDLTLYCTNPYVTKPSTPDLTALVNRAKK